MRVSLMTIRESEILLTCTQRYIVQFYALTGCATSVLLRSIMRSSTRHAIAKASQ